MSNLSVRDLLTRIEELENRLEEAELFNEAIRSGDVDAFTIQRSSGTEIYTLESSDYAYRILIEESSEGAINVSEEGLIVYSNPAFCKLLSLPYEKVIGQSLFDFIDKDCDKLFNELFEESLTGSSKGEISLRVNNKTVPVYMSMTSLAPRLSTVGIIVTDFTAKKRHEQDIKAYQKRLESRNSALIKMNTELQSFAHISSHDLQEPIRKIQIITTRVLEEEYSNLTATGKDLLRRLQNASKRMQLVIDDLLAYSTTNYDKLKLESTDLTKIVEDLRDEFSEEIEKKNAVILTDHLPVIEIIPLHFRQVLHNLISNSLKFSKNNEPPVIKLSSKFVKGKSVGQVQLLPSTTYFHLMYTDNGIGFDPLYSERIFGLFQRLHSKDIYKGTGIGLAIVKKIIENHKGVIIATGKINSGAQFDIFLPQSNIDNS